MSRLVNVIIATVGLIVGAPIIAAAGLAIHLWDGGSVFFRQERIGKDGEPFELLKLRTMSVGAEGCGTGLVVSVGDSRITPLGRLLRAASLDELPQLWNVVHGEMSLVGPRPTVQSQVAQYTAHQRRRLEVAPGLTGWAQVNGRNSLPWDQRIELDIWYVDHKSLLLDLWILARTPKALLSSGDIYGHDGTTPNFTGSSGD